MQIDVEHCTGCGRCVAVCPQRLLSLEVSGTKKRATQRSDQTCGTCAVCCEACLFGAIRRESETILHPQYTPARLPWAPGSVPLMLAPMQGLTNHALRSLFASWVHPDVLFTEFMRVKTVGHRPLSASDVREVGAAEEGVPLVVQLVGPSTDALVAAARAAQESGALHLNLNLGCPYGRMLSGLTGGGMLRAPELLTTLLPALRKAISGSFSVKIRAGYDNPEQIFSLLPLIADSGVDFLVLHPRTVVQEYAGSADHGITARAVQLSRVPVIANGDICTAEGGLRVLRETGAAGLMLGRGAIGDPLLFSRLRGSAPSLPDPAERGAMYHFYLQEMLQRYTSISCGETQLLGKVKAIVRYIDDPDFTRPLKKLRKATTLRHFTAQLAELAGEQGF